MSKIRPSPLGKRVHSLRKQLAITQRDLARGMGLRGDGAGAYVSRVESGVTSPSLRTLRRMAKVLRVTVSELLA